jgi:glycosyltransferase involved in cell wall biosynthesis
VQFIGWIEKKYMPSLYGIMDIYVHAAVMEPFGLVISEAMANGIPMVTTKTGAAADALIQKETCYFTESKNSESIAEGVNWMIENSEIRTAMREKIKKVANEKFNVDRMLSDYISLYKGTLSE